ncbi:MAG: glycosyltransferase family 2 protein [Bdellovibrio sp.]
MKNTPSVCVLMNCYNSDKYLKEALDSVFAQTYQSFEILFIDNQSTDQSSRIAQSYGEKVRYIRTPHHMTLYQARAFALDYVNTKYLAFLDCDDYWHPDKLKHQVGLMEKRSLDFVFGGATLKIETHNKLRKFYYLIYIVSMRLVMALSRPSFQTVIDQLKSYSINLQTVMLRTEKLGAVRFDSKLNLLGDFLFFILLGAKRQVRYFYDPKVVSTTRVHDSQLSRKSAKAWVDEAQYCLMGPLNDVLNLEEKRAFRKIRSSYRANALFEEGRVKDAMKIKSHLKFLKGTFFLNWFKLSLRGFLNRKTA